MANRLSPEIKEFIGELYEADYTANQIKTILGEFDITVSTAGIRYQRPEIKERQKEYRQRPEVKEKLRKYNREYGKEYFRRPEVKEKLRKHNKEYGKEYFRRPEVKDRWSEYALLRRDVKLDTVLNDLDIYIIDLFYTHPKLSVNEIARYIRNIGEKAGSEFMFTDLEKRITVALELIKENAGEDSPIIYSGDDIYEMNPSSSCWKIYEEGLESTVE